MHMHLLHLLMLIALFALLPLTVSAQEAPPPDDTGDPVAPAAAAEGFADNLDEIAEPETAPPPAPTDPLSTAPLAMTVLIDARSDLELLASSQLEGQRPEGWNGSLDISDPQLALLIRLDLEILASTIYNVEQRPPGWFGAVASTPLAIARDIRHDIELLADTVIQPNVRPPGWVGSDPLMRCNRATQSLVGLMERSGITFSADPTSPDFCRQVEIEATRFVETTLLTNDPTAQPNVSLLDPGGSPALSGEASTDFTLAFLDRNALQRAGVLPRGIPFEPVARSYAQFSNMMVVAGEGFTVFVDYTQTTIDSQTFETLPNVDSAAVTPVCAASWCSG